MVKWCENMWNAVSDVFWTFCVHHFFLELCWPVQRERAKDSFLVFADYAVPFLNRLWNWAASANDDNGTITTNPWTLGPCLHILGRPWVHLQLPLQVDLSGNSEKDWKGWNSKRFQVWNKHKSCKSLRMMGKLRHPQVLWSVKVLVTNRFLSVRENMTCPWQKEPSNQFGQTW
jgi:hypothetical protein